MELYMETKMRSIIHAAIIGDALGTPLDGLSKEAIKSYFKNLRTYADISFDKHMRKRWKKPGLYSSISQFMLLASAQSSSHLRGSGWIKTACFMAPPSSDFPYGVFRAPGSAERQMISSITGGPAKIQVPCSRIVAISAGASLSGRMLFERVIRTVSPFSSDEYTIAGSLIYASFLSESAAAENPTELPPIMALLDTTKGVLTRTEEAIQHIFDLGFNPDRIIAAVKEFHDLFIDLVGKNSEHEKIIIRHVNTILKSPATRATINHPLAILPFSAVLSGKYITSDEPLLEIAREGGSAAPLCSIAGGILASVRENNFISEELQNGLINRKRVSGLLKDIDPLSKSPYDLEDFIKNEYLLTLKEAEELRSINRHGKKPEGQKKAKSDQMSRLAEHIVESWTKLDKAQFKKEQRRQKHDQ
jgi:hypothetical protein